MKTRKFLILSAFLLLFYAINAQKTTTTKSLNTSFDKKINLLISKMTLEEKSGMLHGNTVFTTVGVPRLGIPPLKMDDGSLGIREEVSPTWAPLNLTTDFATFYPAPGAMAATWNLELAHLYGNSIGEEARARKVDVLLAPAFNTNRTPLGGRTYEYFTEDPFLNKKIVVPAVIGIQEKDVATCVKHYVANNQETQREFVDVRMSERTLQEIYLPAFKAAVKTGKAFSVMGSYNRFRGEYMCENKPMLMGVLKGEWGFQGPVISDWGGVHSNVKALRNGLDIEMGTTKPFNEFYMAKPLLDSVKAGKIKEKELDDHLRRILRMMFTIKAIDNVGRAKGSINTPKHLKDTYDIAAEAVVLLKNTENILPLDLKKVGSIAILGANATNKFANGGYGSGVKTKNEPTILEALTSKIPKNIRVNYARGYKEEYILDKPGDMPFWKPTVDVLDPALLAEAIDAAKKSDVVLIIGGSNRVFESEGADRKSLKLPFGQDEFITKIKAANPNVAIVMIGGAPYDINTAEKSTSALVWSWFNGSEGSNALADVLLGKINPSGKLPLTMPKKLEDSPAHATNSFPGDKIVEYKEGILVGYRWFDTKKVDPLYPFGHGLSYTNFDFANAKSNKPLYFENETVTVTLDIKNTGKMDGKEVVQVYVSKTESKVERAEKELKGFQKVAVKAGETQKVTIQIPVSELAYYDETLKKFTVEKGNYILKIGNSSRNIKNEIKFSVK